MLSPKFLLVRRVRDELEEALLLHLRLDSREMASAETKTCIDFILMWCKASKLSGKRKSCLCLQDLLYMQGRLPPALKGSDRIRSVCIYDKKK